MSNKEKLESAEFRKCSMRAAILAHRFGVAGLLISTARGAECCEPLLDYEIKTLRNGLKIMRKAAAAADDEYDAKAEAKARRAKNRRAGKR
jgi:hypothetical protein